MEVTGCFNLYYSYEAAPEVMRLVEEFELDVVSQNFNEGCHMVVTVRLHHQPSFEEKP